MTGNEAPARSGMVFDIRRYSVNDGPGIRTTVFLKGCPLRCFWCHNPESQSPGTEFHFREERCILCGGCADACPSSAVSKEGTRMVTDPLQCTLCGTCIEACPADARQLVGKVMTVDQVLAEAVKDRLYFDESGGGITFSGGEPLIQPDFLWELLGACRELDLHAAVDTAGHVRSEMLVQVLGLADLVLFDLKHMDPERHQEATGVSNELILRNLGLLASAGIPVTVRIPLVPGFNDGEENIGEAVRFLLSLERVPDVNLLPYHRAARDKHRRFGLPFRMTEEQEDSPLEIGAICERFLSAGIGATVGG